MASLNTVSFLSPQSHLLGPQRLPLWLSQPHHPQIRPVTTLNCHSAFLAAVSPRTSDTRRELLAAAAVSNSGPRQLSCPVHVERSLRQAHSCVTVSVIHSLPEQLCSSPGHLREERAEGSGLGVWGDLPVRPAGIWRAA